MNMYKNLCLWFLPKELEGSMSIERNNALILINIILFDIALAVIAVLGILFYISSLSETNLKISVIALAFILSGFFVALFLFKLLGSYSLSGNIVSLSCYLPLTYAVLNTGGYDLSPLIPIYAIIPIFSFLITGLKAGIGWGIIVVLTQIALNFVGLWNIEAQQLFSPSEIKHFHSVVPPFTTLIFCTSLVIYESRNRLLKSSLFDERNRFAHQSTHDDLTGIPNRKEFNYQLAKKVSEATSPENKFCVVYIDLDGFKPVNDQHGHHYGDFVLQEVAKRLLTIVRSSDTVARLGGDEFAIILNDFKSHEVVTRIAITIIQTVSQPITYEDVTLHVSASIGLAIFPDHGSSAEAICVSADNAMYEAKVRKNAYCFYGASA